MNFRTTAILFIILVAVGLLVLLTRDTGQQAQTDLPTAEKVVTLAPADVTKISIAPADGPRVVIDRTDGKWKLTEPVNAPAEEAAVSTLISSITALESRGKVAADSQGGFDKPSFVVELSTKDNKTTRLDVGQRSGAGGNMYVRLNGASRADVVPADLFNQLEKEPKEWRSPRLFSTAAAEIRQVRIATTQQSYTLEKHDNDWKMTQPSEMPVDTVAASDITMALANLRAVDFVSETFDNAGRYGLEQPAITAEFSTQAPTTQPSTTQPAFTTIKIGRFDDVLRRNAFAATSSAPGVVTVASTSLEALRKPIADLRDKRVLNIDPEKVTKITISTEKPATTQPTTREASSSTVVLERTKAVVGPVAASMPATAPATAEASTQPAIPPSKWNIASRGGVAADDAKVDQLLMSLRPLRSEKFLAEASSPADSTVYTLTIETTDATHAITIRDPGNSQPPVASYNGLNFNLNTFFTRDLEADFAKDADAPTPMLPGMPMVPGGFPLTP